MAPLTSEAVRAPAGVAWPEGKRFAFTVFDDPDGETVENGRPLYDFLADCGLRTTKGLWPTTNGPRQPRFDTCDFPAYRQWSQELQARGFEIGWHGAGPYTSSRAETLAGLERFEEYFGRGPVSMSQHCYCGENVYWGDQRVGGVYRAVYNVATRWQGHNQFFGSQPGHPRYWSDICRQRLRYVRNFVYAEIDTLSVCPWMPYHDPLRPDVQAWFASAEGATARSYVERISEANQDRLEERGGACIMYTHFGRGFFENGALNARFRELTIRLSKKNGWFVPVSTLLDYLGETRGTTVLGARERRVLERRWLFHKIRFGSA
jgi:hypothetical protein